MQLTPASDFQVYVKWSSNAYRWAVIIVHLTLHNSSIIGIYWQEKRMDADNALQQH